MQDNDLHERQIVLLADKNDALETHIEQQLRELTLLPLNIRRISLRAFQKRGRPRGVALIVTPYATPLPLFSPPLIHADRALTEHQQQQIRKIPNHDAATTLGRRKIAGNATSAIIQNTPPPRC